MASGTRRRTRRIADDELMTASWVVTASSRTVESSTRRVLPLITPVASTTARTASKIRSGDPLARSLFRHNVNTVGWNPSSVKRQTGRDLPSDVRRAAPGPRPGPMGPSERLEHHHRRDHIRRAPTAGPAPTGTGPRTTRRGNSARRCSARNPATDPPEPDARTPRPRPTTQRSDRSCPAPCQRDRITSTTRAPRHHKHAGHRHVCQNTELLSSLLAGRARESSEAWPRFSQQDDRSPSRAVRSSPRSGGRSRSRRSSSCRPKRVQRLRFPPREI